MITRIVLWLILASTVLAQEPEERRSVSSRITGRVVAADTGTPLSGAVVSLYLSNWNNGPASPSTTDANGNFDLVGIPAGTYRISVSRAGYFNKGSGAGRPSGLNVTVRQGQTAELATISMTRGGAITGRILDELGQPAAQARVHVLRYQYGTDGLRAPAPAGVSDITDDLGHFRVYGLPAGDFAVVASGRNAEGNRAGFSLIDESAETAPTYYPGSINAAEAQTLSLRVGQEASVEFRLLDARLVSVSGTALTPEGAPAAGMSVWLRASTSTVAMSSREAGKISPDGSFSISNVAPGDYWVDLHRRPGAPGEKASMPLTVGTDDVTGVRVVTTRGATISGTVVFEGARPDDFTLSLQLADELFGAFGATAGAYAAVTADGRFEVRGVVGRVLFEPMTGTGLIVKSVLVDGVERLDRALDVTGKESIGDVRVTMSDRLTSIAGRVTDDRARPLGNQLVILVRTERAIVRKELGVRTVRTDNEGRFQTRGMRPGTYVVGVVDDLEAWYHLSPEFQERLRMYGQRFSLADGQEVVLDLEPTPGLQ